MASKKISELPATTPPLNPAGLVPYTDPADTSEAVTGTTKRTTLQSIADLVVPFDPSGLESAIAEKAPLVHTHAGLSTTIPSGSLWGGDGTGTPTAVAVGSGLTLTGGTLGGSAGLLAAIATADPGGLLIYDTFDRTNGSAIGTANSGQAWTVDGVLSIAIDSGRARRVGGSSLTTAAWIDSGHADVVIEATLEIPSVAISDIVFRYLDINNYLLIQISGSGVRVRACQAGTHADQAVLTATSQVSSRRRYRVIADGATLTVSNAATGTVIGTHTLSAALVTTFGDATKHGFAERSSGTDRQSWWDNYTVRRIR